jgi:hypothetical protein
MSRRIVAGINAELTAQRLTTVLAETMPQIIIEALLPVDGQPSGADSMDNMD